MIVLNYNRWSVYMILHIIGRKTIMTYDSNKVNDRFPQVKFDNPREDLIPNIVPNWRKL